MGGTGFTGSLGGTGFTGSVGYTGSLGGTGFTGSLGGTGFTGSLGGTGFTGSLGSNGFVGSQGDKAGLKYSFSTTITAGTTSNGDVRYNNSLVSSVTALYINYNDTSGTAFNSFFAKWSDSTNTSNKGHVIVESNVNGSTVHNIFRVISVSDNTTYYTVNVAFVAGSTLPAASEPVAISFVRTGDAGSIGYTGSQSTTPGYTGSIGVGYTGSAGTGGGGGGTPGGSNTQVQYNNSGVFAGSIGFTFDETSNNVVVANTFTAQFVNATANAYVGAKLQIGQPAAFDFGGLAALEVDLNQDTYLQVVVQNGNTGTLSSSDFVATADNGNDSVNFIDLGINGSNYNQPTFNISGPLDGYLYVSNGALTIGTASPEDIIFHTSGTTTTQERMRITSSGFVSVGNSISNMVANSTKITVGNSTVNSTITAANFIVSNSTVTVDMSLPTTTQQNGSWYFHANGAWVATPGYGLVEMLRRGAFFG